MYQSAKQKVKRLDADRLRALERLELGFDINSTDASAISVVTPVTLLSSAGVETRTLANGYEGQVKILYCKVYVGDIVVTPANLFTAYDHITFNAAGDIWVGIFHAGAWVTLFIAGSTALSS